jgi:hypothetical protein
MMFDAVAHHPRVKALLSRMTYPVRVALGYAVLLVVWVFGLLPALVEQSDRRQALETVELGVAEARTLAAQVAGKGPTVTENSLQVVERISREQRLGGRMTRVTPLKDSGGLEVEFEGVSLVMLTPFLHAVAFSSPLTIDGLELRQSPNADGLLAARLTLKGTL